jgi:hypothetical protein
MNGLPWVGYIGLFAIPALILAWVAAMALRVTSEATGWAGSVDVENWPFYFAGIVIVVAAVASVFKRF